MSRVRPDWYEVYYGMLDVLRQRSTCPRLHTAGLVFNEEHQMLVWGYNGAPRSQPHCEDVGCDLDEGGHCRRACHVEYNILGQASNTNVSIKSCSIILPDLPCDRCARLLIAANIQNVIYSRDMQSYDNSYTKNIFRDNGVSLQLVPYDFRD